MVPFFIFQWPLFNSFSQFTPFVLWPVNSPHKGQSRGALMFSLICALNNWLSEQSRCWWFETPSRSLWCHCNGPALNHWYLHPYTCRNRSSREEPDAMLYSAILPSGFITIIRFQNYFPQAVSNRPTYISLWVEQPTAGYIAIFHKCCCYIKYGGIITNLTLWNPWGILIIWQGAVVWNTD